MKNCVNCGISIAHKKATAKFCNNICRAEYWRYGENDNSLDGAKKNNLVPKDKPSDESQPKLLTTSKGIEGLRGVLEDNKTENSNNGSDNNSPEKESDTIKIELDELDRKRKAAISEHNDLVRQHNLLLHNKGNYELLPQFLSITGGLAGLSKTDFNDFRVKDFILMLTGSAIGAIVGINYKKQLEQERLNALRQLSKIDIPNCKSNIASITNKIKEKKEDLYHAAIKERLEKFMAAEPESVSITNTNSPVPAQTPDLSGAKIIKSNELKNLSYSSLNFKGDWKKLLGKPEITFKIAVYGMPGQGKSTFCLKLADYLAKDFGSVIFISSEEGFSKTMKDKLDYIDVSNPNLYIADIRSYEELLEQVKPDCYHFIIIDSLNHIGVDIKKLKAIHEHYKNSAVISISQATKKGDMRGSLDIEHEVDVTLKVENGFAVAKKNRFKEIGFEFPILKR